jgi:hypothetical protein
MATVPSTLGQTITHERPEVPVSPTTILGYLLDVIMILVQAVIYSVEVVVIFMLPFLLLLGIFPLMFVCAVLVMVLGSALHAFHLA